MIFDFYQPIINKDGKTVPGVKAERLDLATFQRLLDAPDVKSLCDQIEKGEREKKTSLPAICWNGKASNGYRKASDMMATQYFMVDVDHVEPAPPNAHTRMYSTSDFPQGEESVDSPEPQAYVRKVWDEIVTKRMTERMMNPSDFGLKLAHITPSSKGLRLVCKAIKGYSTIEEHMEWLNRELELDKYGDFDTVVKDLSRLSFLVPRPNVLFLDEELFKEEELREGPIKTSNYGKIKTTAGNSAQASTSQAKNSLPEGEGQGGAEKSQEQIAKEEEERRQSPYWDYSFNGYNVRDIAEQWVKDNYPDGVQEGRRHSVYNQMVKDFRHICDNNPIVLYIVLPRFEPTSTDRLSQCTSICKLNNYGEDYPPKFEYFLRKHGYIAPLQLPPSGGEPGTSSDSTSSPEGGGQEGADVDDIYVPAPLPKKLPPVFREILTAMPEQFIVPAANALLPIMGAMTGWLRAIYPTDLREMSTTFFSVIYAPPSTGKSFIERYEQILLAKIKQRDDICQLRDQLFNSITSTQSDNKDGPKEIYTQYRAIPARNSLGEILKKMVANKGRIAYTYCAEIDEWANGVKAAGNDKDDLVRKAWDNGEYGQSFSSPKSFKGKVNVYWNLLLCGTPRQMFKYFKDPENGLVSRCSFTPIEKKRFCIAPRFKPISKAARQVLDKFVNRCDAKTYVKPLTMTKEQAVMFADDLETFDREVPWDFEFQPLQYIDLNWLFNEIERWQKVQNKINAKSVDIMADDLIPRVMIRGFRLGLLCHALWDKVGQKEREVIVDFVKWWMTEDLHYITELWRDKQVTYNLTIKKSKRDLLFDALPDIFAQGDYASLANKYFVKSPFKKTIHDWKVVGLIVEVEGKKYKKLIT